MKQETIKVNLWTFLAVCTVIVCIQMSLVKEVYANGDILLQAEIKDQKIQKCEDFYRIILPTKLRLTNKTDKSLLLIRDSVSIIGIETAKSESDFEKEIYISKGFYLPGATQKNLLNLQSPTGGRTEIIPRNGQYEWNSYE